MSQWAKPGLVSDDGVWLALVVIAGDHASEHRCVPIRDLFVRLVKRRSRRPGVSGSLAFVYSLLTKRRAVDFCRLHSSLCPMR